MDLNKSGLNSQEWSFSKTQPSPVFYGVFLGVEAFISKMCAVTPLPFPSLGWGWAAPCPQQLLVPQGRHTQQHRILARSFSPGPALGKPSPRSLSCPDAARPMASPCRPPCPGTFSGRCLPCPPAEGALQAACSTQCSAEAETPRQ